MREKETIRLFILFTYSLNRYILLNNGDVYLISFHFLYTKFRGSLKWIKRDWR